MKAILLTAMIAYIGGNIYLFIRSWQQLSALPTAWRVMFAVAFWLVATALFIAMGARDITIPEPVTRTLFRAGSVWMVFILYMVSLLIVVDVAHLIFPRFNGFYYALLLTIALLIYGNWNFRHPKIYNFEIEIEKPIEKPLRIVAVSDVHLGYGTDKQALQRYVEMINAQQPDIVLIAGDLIDNSLKPLNEQRMDEELRQIKAPMGVFMALGNHEYISGEKGCLEFLDKSNITPLRDSIATLPNGVQIIGRDDRTNRRRQPLEHLLDKANTEQPIIVIDHQPYHLAKADSLGVDFQFSGHTHHGQVFPLNLITNRMYEQSHGYRHWSHAHIYVSSGLSLWGPPFRIGTHSDMAVITLKGK